MAKVEKDKEVEIIAWAETRKITLMQYSHEWDRKQKRKNIH